MSLLTLEDLAWLRQYRESLSGWSRYQLAKLRGASCGELMEIAGQVLVLDRDRYVMPHSPPWSFDVQTFE